MLRSVLRFFNSGHERSVRAKKNILFSLVFRGISMLSSFLMVPLLVYYLDTTQYGIWLTLTSVISWMGFFDIGLGNGFRNKYAAAKARGEILLAKKYMSTTYALLALISFILFSIFFGVHFITDWSKVFNTPDRLGPEVSQLVFLVFSVFSLQFVIKIINVVLTADQKPAASQGINTTISVLSLLGVWLLMEFAPPSLFYVGLVVSLSSLLVPLIFSIWYFRGKNRSLRPGWKYVDFSYSRNLLSLGFQFFIMQGAALIVFATDNMIITQLLGPEEVTPYNIAFRFFNLVAVLFSVITMPFWSAFTEAYQKGEMTWIKRIIKKVSMFWLLTSVLVLIMLLFSNNFYSFWLGKQYNKVDIPLLLSALMAVWVLLRTGVDIFSNFLSGVSKIRLSLYHAVVVSILNIPLSVYFARNLEMGSAGVILASCLCILPRALFQPVQTWLIVKKKAGGIWNK